MTWEKYGDECREEGIEQGHEDFIGKLLKKGKTPKEISELIDCDIQYVEDIKNFQTEQIIKNT